ncbi:hypothetical protein HAHI6034_05820 [Hathewaya histolytica]|uniref:Uncharacterized protein n=1 Tax=Hathewaya histolytica TaxID=1498 RepID=A0A4V6KDB6_HATHI|nr:hypothetical protein [Hathewaya histolytica]VTQ89667.1 Uncharacterised protein [Hathewaya histolytica]
MENKVLQDHEKRIRKLEESDLQQRIQLSNIEKSQSEIKAMISETSKEQQKTLNEFTLKILSTFTDKNKKDGDLKFYNTKQFWAIAASIVTAVIAFFNK